MKLNALMFLFASFVFIISTQSHAESNPKKLTLYSVKALEQITPILKRFTEKTGIQIELVNGTHQELMGRLTSEGASTPADLFITKDLVYLAAATNAGVYAPMQSELLTAQIPSHLRHPENLWFLLAYRARTIMYSPERVAPSQLSTYEALAESQWKGRLCLRGSSASYNQALLTSLIHHQGVEKAETIVKGWINNLAAPTFPDDTAVLKAIAAGQCDVGITNTYYLADILSRKPEFPVKPFFANQGTSGVHINGYGAGLVRYSKNIQEARELVEFLTSPEIQVAYADAGFEFPANPAATPTTIVKTWGLFNTDVTSFQALGDLAKEATQLADRAGYR